MPEGKFGLYGHSQYVIPEAYGTTVEQETFHKLLRDLKNVIILGGRNYSYWIISPTGTPILHAYSRVYTDSDSKGYMVTVDHRYIDMINKIIQKGKEDGSDNTDIQVS